MKLVVADAVGGFFSIENPSMSLLWSTASATKVSRLPGCFDVVGDQCRFGGLYRKPTRWRTNAPSVRVLGKDCPGPPAHGHEPLQGLVTLPDGTVVWRTSLAAAYPEDLCNALAREFLADASEAPQVPEVFMDQAGTNDVTEAISKKARRKL